MKIIFSFEYPVYANNRYAITRNFSYMGSFVLGFWNPMRQSGLCD